LLECAYAIFSKDASINAALKVSVQDFFSQLILRAPGTTTFQLVLGLWGIPNGKTGTMRLSISTPEQEDAYSGEWETKVSDGEPEVHNVIWNLSKIPLSVEGVYTFVVYDQDTKREISKRLLTVSFSREGEESFE
jgi:hypothetical protein